VPVLDAFQVWPLGGEYLLRAILIPFLILSLAAVGLNILTGYCGQLSLGSGAFMAIGAYSAYKFGTGIHIPLETFTIDIPPLPVSAVHPARRADGGVRRHPVRRAEPAHQGLYLAVATLAAQFFFDWLSSA
jgi:branched-chain amino acid transport system permease protein